MSPRLALFLCLSSVGIVATSSPVPLIAQYPGEVQTTARLNLRSCPDTQGCRVITTLPVGSHLRVMESRGVWLRIIVDDSQEQTGWVHSDYVAPIAPTVPTMEGSGKRFHWSPASIAIGFWLIVLAAIGLYWLQHASVRHAVAIIIGYTALGSLVIVTQFGSLIASLVAPVFDLQGISWLWTATATTSFGYSSVALSELAGIVLMITIIPGAAVGRRAYLQGLGAGFLIVPAFVAALFVITIILRVTYWILSFVLWPIRWLLENVVLPLLSFLLKPLAWLWKTVFMPLIRLISPPFIWLWKSILLPLWLLAQRFIVHPILTIAVAVLLLIFVVAPFAVAGLVSPMESAEPSREQLRPMSYSDKELRWACLVSTS